MLIASASLTTQRTPRRVALGSTVAALDFQHALGWCDWLRLLLMRVTPAVGRLVICDLVELGRSTEIRPETPNELRGQRAPRVACRGQGQLVLPDMCG